MSFICSCPVDLGFSYAFEDSKSGALTFAGVNIGPDLPGRIVVVMTSDQAGTPVSSVTVGGVAATCRVGASSHAQIWTASGVVGATATITLTASTSSLGIGVYALYGALTEVPSATATGTTSVTIAAPAGGCVIGCVAANSAAVTPVWTGLTQDYSATVSANKFSSASAAFLVANPALAVSATGPPTAMAVAAWP